MRSNMATKSSFRKDISKIIEAYANPLTRWYCVIRFKILRQRFLDEISQYLPESGEVIDLGCGFGLFALYFASKNKNVIIHGIDINAKRIAMAKRAAEHLRIKNVTFNAMDAIEFVETIKLNGAYMLDLVHHIPRQSFTVLVDKLLHALLPGSRLVIKDVERRPFLKMAFTWFLDKVMDYKAPVDYWSQKEMLNLLNSKGAKVYRHAMVDILPYPHVIYIAKKT